MARRETQLSNLEAQNGHRPGRNRFGAAHRTPRDAYKDVPILQQPTWSLDIIGYFYLGGLSSGSFMLGTMAKLFGGEKLQPLARTAHAVSFATMLACPPLLIHDLGKPARFHHMLRIFKPESPMNVGSWTLTTHGVITTLRALQLVGQKMDLPVVGPLLAAVPEEVLTAAGMPSALTLGGYTGVLLGTTSVPVWSVSPLLGALFMASALAAGSAATRLAQSFVADAQTTEPEALSSIGMALGCSEIVLLNSYLATTGRAARALTRGREGGILLGAIVGALMSIACEIAGKRAPGNARTWSRLGAIASLIGGLCLRWAFVKAGHVSAKDRESTLEAMQPRRESPGWGP